MKARRLAQILAYGLGIAPDTNAHKAAILNANNISWEGLEYLLEDELRVRSASWNSMEKLAVEGMLEDVRRELRK